VEQLNLPQYAEPLYPFANELLVKARPLYEQATKAVLPHITPYLDLAEPYIGGARPHLDAVPQKELLLIVGGIFGGVFLLQLVLALTATCRRNGSPLRAFTPTVFWLLMCTIIHSWIEYAFVFRRENNASGFQSGLDLYGAADYRYGFGKTLTLEAGTAAMEAITAFVTGPLCLLLAWGIVGQKAWRWSVQIIVCTCQIYGLAWFASHPFFSVDKVASEDPFLYWVVFIGFNAPWSVHIFFHSCCTCFEDEVALQVPLLVISSFLVNRLLCSLRVMLFARGIVPPLMLLSALWKVNSTMNKAQAEQFAAVKAAKSAKKGASAAPQESKPSASQEKKKSSK
jgi:hypothetical protein